MACSRLGPVKLLGQRHRADHIAESEPFEGRKSLTHADREDRNTWNTEQPAAPSKKWISDHVLDRLENEICNDSDGHAASARGLVPHHH